MSFKEKIFLPKTNFNFRRIKKPSPNGKGFFIRKNSLMLQTVRLKRMICYLSF